MRVLHDKRVDQEGVSGRHQKRPDIRLVGADGQTLNPATHEVVLETLGYTELAEISDQVVAVHHGKRVQQGVSGRRQTEAPPTSGSRFQQCKGGKLTTLGDTKQFLVVQPSLAPMDTLFHKLLDHNLILLQLGSELINLLLLRR